MSSKLEICNMALGLVNGYVISDPAESSAEALALTTAYEPVLVSMLEQHPWSFATKLASLAVLDGEETGEFDYVYELPADCIKVQGTIHNLDEQPEFKIRGRKFYTNENPVELEYTKKVLDTGSLSPTFVSAFAAALAAFAAPRLGALKMQQSLFQQAASAIRTAKASDAKNTNKKSTANRTFVNVRR